MARTAPQQPGGTICVLGDTVLPVQREYHLKMQYVNQKKKKKKNPKNDDETAFISFINRCIEYSHYHF